MTDTPAPPKPSRTALSILLMALVLGIALTVIALLAALRTAALPATPTPQIEGITAIVPPDPLADFTLTDQRGEAVRLSDFNGKTVLLFFGYTHCPDFCPLTLADFTQIKAQLGDLAERVSFVFVSVDGERDTPEVLDQYVTRFDPTFVGMTGTEAQLEALAAPYGLSFTLEKESADDDDYSVTHSTLTYIIDPQQRLHSLVSFGTSADVVADYLRVHLLQPQPTPGV